MTGYKRMFLIRTASIHTTSTLNSPMFSYIKAIIQTLQLIIRSSMVPSKKVQGRSKKKKKDCKAPKEGLAEFQLGRFSPPPCRKSNHPQCHIPDFDGRQIENNHAVRYNIHYLVLQPDHCDVEAHLQVEDQLP